MSLVTEQCKISLPLHKNLLNHIEANFCISWHKTNSLSFFTIADWTFFTSWRRMEFFVFLLRLCQSFVLAWQFITFRTSFYFYSWSCDWSTYSQDSPLHGMTGVLCRVVILKTRLSLHVLLLQHICLRYVFSCWTFTTQRQYSIG